MSMICGIVFGRAGIGEVVGVPKKIARLTFLSFRLTVSTDDNCVFFLFEKFGYKFYEFGQMLLS